MLAGENFFTDSEFIRTCAILAYLVLLCLPFLAVNFFKNIIKINSKQLRWLAVAAVLIYCSLLAFVYPGFVGYDDVFSMDVILGGPVWGWQSLTYSVVLGVGFLILGNFGFTTILSIGIFLYIFVKILTMLDLSTISERKKLLLGCGLLLLAMHPLNQALLLFHCRDTLFSLFLLFLGLQIFQKPITWKTTRIVVFSFALVVLGEFRQEAKIYLILLPLILWFLNWSKRQLFTLLSSICLFSVFYYFFCIKYFNVQSYTKDYQVTAYVMPLSQIFHDVPLAEIPEQHRKNIEAVFNIQLLKDKFNPIDIDPFHAGGFNHESSDEQWQKFTTSARALIMQYPKLFLKNRIYLAKSMLNIGHPPLIVADERRMNKEPKFVAMMSRYNSSDKVLPISKAAETYRNELMELNKNENPVIWIFSSFVLPLLFLLFCLFSINYYPVIGGLALIVAVRLPLLFLLAPASYVKYIYSLMLFFTFGSIIYMKQFFERRKTS